MLLDFGNFENEAARVVDFWESVLDDVPARADCLELLFQV